MGEGGLMSDNLEKALSLLRVFEVRLRNANVRLVDELEPQELKNHAMDVQGLRGVGKIKEISLKEGEDDWWEYNFFYATGVRLVEKDKEGDPVVEIQATFNAVYRSRDQIGSDLIKKFSEEHVAYHVWPYWREFVQSSCTRLGIAPIRIPLYRIGSEA